MILRVRHGFTFIGDLIAYSFTNGNIWLLPLLVALFVGGLVVTVGQVAAPFMYTIF